MKGGNVMPACENCDNKWSWRQTIKKTTTLNPAMTCPYCEEKQYQTKKSKVKTGMLTPIVLFPLIIRIFFNVPEAILLNLYLILFILVIFLYPFLVKLSSKEEHLF